MRRDYVSRFFPCLWVNHTTNSLLVTNNVVIPYSRLQPLKTVIRFRASSLSTMSPLASAVASTETCFYGLMRGADPYS